MQSCICMHTLIKSCSRGERFWSLGEYLDRGPRGPQEAEKCFVFVFYAGGPGSQKWQEGRYLPRDQHRSARAYSQVRGGPRRSLLHLQRILFCEASLKLSWACVLFVSNDHANVMWVHRGVPTTRLPAGWHPVETPAVQPPGQTWFSLTFQVTFGAVHSGCHAKAPHQQQKKDRPYAKEY